VKRWHDSFDQRLTGADYVYRVDICLPCIATKYVESNFIKKIKKPDSVLRLIINPKLFPRDRAWMVMNAEAD
jgi:hypothetical protein